MRDQGANPQITTIIPTFRRPQLLRRAVKSILNQTYSHFRICIYDNASGDETRSVAEEFCERDARVQYYCHAENVGGLKNFIYGARRVNTPFFSFLSDDDFLLPKFYETAVAGFEKHPQAMFSALATLHADETGAAIRTPLLQWKEGLYLPPTGLEAIVRHWHPEWTSVLFRREAWVEMNGLDEAVGGPSDLDFELRIAARYPIVVSTEVGAVFTIHSSSESFLGRFQASWLGWEKMIGNLTEDESIPLSVRSSSEKLLRERLKGLLLWNGFGCVLRKNWKHADDTADALREKCNSRGAALVLRGASRLFRLFPPAYYALRCVNGLRKILTRLYVRKLRKVWRLCPNPRWN